MSVPATYIEWLTSLGFLAFNVGIGGVTLHAAAELEAAQVGYSISPEGQSFVEDKGGGWHSNWVAIGYETTHGDPIILVIGSNSYQVLTAPHGEGSWEPEKIADNLQGFQVALSIVRSISVGREGPILLEKNPIPSALRESALADIAAANPSSEMFFWETLLEQP